MFRKFTIGLAIGLLLVVSDLRAGLEWSASQETLAKGKKTLVLIKAYAQGGNVREEFIEVSKESNPTMKEGMYWLYSGEKDLITVVDPKEKTYMEISMESAMQTMGAVGQLVKITITNPTAEATAVGEETVLSYPCRHIKLHTSYDMETKIAFIKSKNHTDSVQDFWGTEGVPLTEFSSAFKNKSFQTGFADLDVLIKKQAEATKNLGFILKSQTNETVTDSKGKSENRVVTMNVTEIVKKDISANLFKVPDGYTKQEFTPGQK